MKRFIILLFLLIIPSASWGVDFFPKGASSPPEPPNPYDLKINWWDYYDVDSKTLLERQKASVDYYEQLSQKLSAEENQTVQGYFDRIEKGLTLLIELKMQQVAIVQPVIPIKVDKKYTYQEWIGLSKKMLEERESLEYLKLRLSLANSSYKSSGRDVDSRFSAYLKQANTSPNRLVDGLTIIQGRILVAIEKIQIVNLKKLVQKKTTEIAGLQEQIKNSYQTIDFSTANIEEIDAKLAEAKAQEREANSKFIFSYEHSPGEEEKSALSDETLLNNKIEYEISRVNVINLEMQKIMVGWAKHNQKINRKELTQQIQHWRSTIDDIRAEIPYSENSSELILQQSLKSIALQNETYVEDFSSNQSLELAQAAILKIEQLKNILYVNNFLADQLDVIKRRSSFNPFDWISAAWDNFVSFFQANAKWFQQGLFKIGELPITPFGIIKFILIIVISIFAGNFARHFIHRIGRKQSRIGTASIYLLSRMSYYTIVVLGILIAGYTIGLDLTIFAYVAGALAIWVGFSLQSIFHNFISGMIVLITKTVRINDVIELDTGEVGTVTDLNLRTTVLRTGDGKDIIIPNADIVNKKFLNLTLSSYTIRIRVPFRVGLNEDKNKIAEIVIQAAKKVEITSDITEPELWFVGYGDNYLKLELAVWINTIIQAKTASRASQYYWAIDDVLRENGIAIPIPSQSIQILGDSTDLRENKADP